MIFYNPKRISVAYHINRLETLCRLFTHCPCGSPNVHDKHIILNVSFSLNGKLMLL